MVFRYLLIPALLIAGLSLLTPESAKAACQCSCQFDPARQAELGEVADSGTCTQLCESQVEDNETLADAQCTGAAVCECCAGSPPPDPVINTLEECKTACGTAGSGFGGSELGGFKSFGDTTTACAGEEKAAKAAAPTIPRLVNPLGVGMTFQHLIGRVIKAVLGISGSLALAIFVWGGFTWLTSGGSPDKIDKGKRMLVWATLGLALIFGAYAITNFVIEAVTGATGA